MSLFNVSYKFKSKLLTNRLHMVLSKLISPKQSIFVLSKDIHDYNLIIHEIFTTFLRKRNKK